MIFQDATYQKEFERKGFVVIPGLLKATDLPEIDSFFNNLPKQTLPFYTTNWIPDEAYKRKVHEFLQPRLDAAASSVLRAFRSVFSYYLVKQPHATNKVAIHQDWSLTDESLFSGLTIWIPLVDTNETNGSFYVLPYSHRFMQNVRGSNIDMPYSAAGNDAEAKLLKPVYLKAGDAIFFHHRLIHFSPPNLGKEIRVAIGHTVLPLEAPMYHYYKTEAAEEQVYQQQVDDDFLLRYSFKEPLERYFKGEAKAVFWKEYQLNFMQIRNAYLKSRLTDFLGFLGDSKRVDLRHIR
jgi:hypothetical protein